MKTLSENSVIRTQLAKIAFGAPIRHAGLTVVPLIALNMDVPNWLLLEEALLAGCVDITEISSAASVSMLRLTNHGNRAVLPLDGEELVGAKQNRVLNTTIIAAGHQTVEIPVSCVEQGRWAYRSKTFRSSGRSLYASVRRQKLEDVHYSLLRLRRHVSNQGALWSKLADRATQLKIQSPTGAMGDVFDCYSETLAVCRTVFAAQSGQVGALVYLGSKWSGLEVLAGPRIFANAWPRLLSGYVMDAVEADVVDSPGARACNELRAVLEAEAEVFPGVGLGEEYRFHDRGVVGAALVAEETLAHLAAFPG